MKRIITAIILLLMTVGPAYAVAETYTWCAPPDGTPVVYYNVQVEVNGGGWVDVGTYVVVVEGEDGSYDLTYVIGIHQLRVQGVDANGNLGGWSIASDAYDYEGAPGVACKPRRGE